MGIKIPRPKQTATHLQTVRKATKDGGAPPAAKKLLPRFAVPGRITKHAAPERKALEPKALEPKEHPARQGQAAVPPDHLRQGGIEAGRKIWL